MQKVLIITYYWPPAGGPGVQRWLNFVKFLPEFGIEPIVFIPENPTYPVRDKLLIAEIPNDVEIISCPIWEPYGWASFFSRKKTKRISSGVIQKYKEQGVLERIMLWVRGNLFVPDARKFWIKPAVKRLEKLIPSKDIKIVITTGPPHSVHLIGLSLKEKLGVRWMADFRDPWTSIGYHKKLKLTTTNQRRHRQLEKKVLDNSDQLIVTSDTTEQEFQRLTKTPIEVITNGFEGGPVAVEPDTKFSLSHIGTLLTDRNPRILWETLAELTRENNDFEKALQVNLVGVVGDGVMESVDAAGLSNYVRTMGYVSHGEAQKFQSSAQVLLLLEIDSEETRGIIPGKFFEYLRAERPILALGPENWEAGSLVEKHQAGKYLALNQKDALKALLLEWFGLFQQRKLDVNTKGISQYHRRELTKVLTKLLAWESS